MSYIIALDYGEKRIGLAGADLELNIASPLDYLENNSEFIKKISELIEKKNVVAIILGYPLNLKGQKTKKTTDVDAFYTLLCRHFSQEIIKVDERLTSIQAQKNLYRLGHTSKSSRNKIDSQAAAILLETYLKQLSKK